MTSRENKDNPIFEEKRKEAAKGVVIEFTDGDDKLMFNVMDDNHTAKYKGKLDPDGNNHFCACDSYFYGMKYVDDADGKPESQYLAEHGHTFRCKHIMKAWEERSK